MRSLVIASLLASFCGLAAAVGCLDESGSAVDWFVAIKVPKLKGGDGLSYYYVDANQHDSWTLSTNSLGRGSGAIDASMQRIYKPPSGSGALVWNDEYPDGQEPSGVAHSKGTLLFDSSSGMYMIHSCPHYPPMASYSFPETAAEYGQSFLCLSLDGKSVETVLTALLITRPGVYIQTGLSRTLQSKYHNLTAVMNGTYIAAPTAKAFSISTAGGVPFKLFGKNKEWNDYLYEMLVAPSLNSDLIAETWTKGAISNITPTFCKGSKYDWSVYNAEHVQFGEHTWDRNQDHSKWIVGVSTDWFCVGGINRQNSQNLRGGGTCCSNQISGMQQLFYNAVIDVNPCGTGQVTPEGSKPPAPLELPQVGH